MRGTACLTLTCFALAFACGALAGEPTTPDPSAVEFFERDVRPLFVEKCQSCHGGKKTNGGLSLTSRDAVLKGGDRGAAVVPGKPTDSLLIAAVGRAGDLKMPPKEPLSAQEIEKLTRWVARGAVWPHADTSKRNSGGTFEVTQKQRQWWAFQPVRS